MLGRRSRIALGARAAAAPRCATKPAPAAIAAFHAGFPADVLWEFRLASLAISATFCATIGLGFGVFAERLLTARAPRATAPLAAEA